MERNTTDTSHCLEHRSGTGSILRRAKVTKSEIENAWKRYSSPPWIHEQSDAFIELECIMTKDYPVAMPIDEISYKTGLSQESVRDLLKSAYNKLKPLLSQYERK